jgi:hypothetical protein
MPSVDSIRGLPAQVLSGSAVGFHYRIGSPFQRFYVCGVCSFVPCVSRLKVGMPDQSKGTLMPCSGKDDLEVVVVGAGAAGIGAAMRLAAARVSFTVLEARNRVGGRAYTSADAPFPLDLGCGWLHSADRNPWTQIAADAGSQSTRPFPAGALRASTSGSVPRIKRVLFWRSRQE